MNGISPELVVAVLLLVAVSALTVVRRVQCDEAAQEGGELAQQDSEVAQQDHDPAQCADDDCPEFEASIPAQRDGGELR
ncbi:hypothetical protein [Streptomyces sp. NPDC047070]|uniref:hypothetical protein n=1 Tax=Streptomyces sp. NPDC047070 TaxID=3154923 RepID=UPI003451619A